MTAIDQGSLTTVCGTNQSAPQNRVYVANETTANVSIFNVSLPVEPVPGPGGAVPCNNLDATVSVGSSPGGPDRLSRRNRVYVPVPATNEIRVFQGNQVVAIITR